MFSDTHTYSMHQHTLTDMCTLYPYTCKYTYTHICMHMCAHKQGHTKIHTQSPQLNAIDDAEPDEGSPQQLSATFHGPRFSTKYKRE